MRGTTATIAIILLLAAPLAAPMAVPLPTISRAFDPDDATLLRLLTRDTPYAPRATHEIDLATLPQLPDLLTRIGARAGATLTPDDIAAFDGLDPRVEEPVRIMLTAIDQAWILRDAAFSHLTREEQLELYELTLHGERDTPRGIQLASNTDQRFLVEAAILLTDTAENIVIPQLKNAIAQGAWPTSPAADPIGILRLGGGGNDVETLNRVLQIDPQGNDLYRNNAGATNANELLVKTGLQYAIALSIDFDGDDHYNQTSAVESQGGGGLGIGILLDFAGNDLYYCTMICQGAAVNGVGIHRDYGGDDRYYGGDRTKGAASDGASFLRDDGGNDFYYCSAARCGGFAVLYPSTAVMWDRGAVDRYDARSAVDAFGVGIHGGRGWLADEGPDPDNYSTAYVSGPNKHGCNDCTWQAGWGTLSPTQSGPDGRGNDNSGGLAFLLTSQGTGLAP